MFAAKASECFICSALTFEGAGLIQCCKGSRDSCCNVCLVRRCRENPTCPYCREEVPQDLVQAMGAIPIANPPPAAPVAADDGFIEGIFYGAEVQQQQADVHVPAPFQEPAYVPPPIAADPPVVEDPVDARQFIPCRYVFGRNGSRLVGGCSYPNCPFSHVAQPCAFGPNCERRGTCTFVHNH